MVTQISSFFLIFEIFRVRWAHVLRGGCVGGQVEQPYESSPAGTLVDGSPRACSSLWGGHVGWQVDRKLCHFFGRNVEFADERTGSFSPGVFF